MSAPTMLEVARRANVALSTVSYALNGTRPVSEATRRRISQAMAELGYQPNALARGLASKRSRIIAPSCIACMKAVSECAPYFMPGS